MVGVGMGGQDGGDGPALFSADAEDLFRGVLVAAAVDEQDAVVRQQIGSHLGRGIKIKVRAPASISSYIGALPLRCFYPPFSWF